MSTPRKESSLTMAEFTRTPNRMDETGNVLLGIVCAGLVGMLGYAAAFIHANRPSGTSSQVIVAIAFAIGPFDRIVAALTLLSETVAIGLLGFGAFRYRSRILRSPQWIISAVGTVAIALVIAWLVAVAVVIASAPA